jgi:hypothetical protein
MTVRLIEVTQAEYWRVQDHRARLTQVYPTFDDSRFCEWLAKEFETEPINDGYKIAVRR